MLLDSISHSCLLLSLRSNSRSISPLDCADAHARSWPLQQHPVNGHGSLVGREAPLRPNALTNLPPSRCLAPQCRVVLVGSSRRESWATARNPALQHWEKGR
ncbi:hypothetical protein MRB53_042005 [Persea americana]|nr:hypothetical protein MRB53_042005 [Persea americana]